MAITIYDSDYDALWQEANPSDRDLESKDFSETLQLVPDRLGQGYIRSIQLNGINLLLFNYQLHEDLFIIRKGQNTTEISREFGFHLSGDRYGKHTGENFVQWGIIEDPDDFIQFASAKEPILKLDIHLESVDGLSQSVLEILEELPTETKKRISDRNLIEEFDCITPTMKLALTQIINCPFQGKTKQIYLESKCLELVTLKLEQLKQKDELTKKSYSLKSDNIERIHLAKDILTANFDNPPSLIQLARQVGLNDCTLKRGFREVLGTTAFGYLHNYRLEQACLLLLERSLKISEVAHKVGFANYTALSKGFRQKYGVSPKQYQMQCTFSKN